MRAMAGGPSQPSETLGRKCAPGYGVLHPFDRVCGFGGHAKGLGMYPDVRHLLQVAARLEKLDGHGDVDEVEVSREQLLPQLHTVLCLSTQRI